MALLKYPHLRSEASAQRSEPETLALVESPVSEPKGTKTGAEASAPVVMGKTPMLELAEETILNLDPASQLSERVAPTPKGCAVPNSSGSSLNPSGKGNAVERAGTPVSLQQPKPKEGPKASTETDHLRKAEGRRTRLQSAAEALSGTKPVNELPFSFFGFFLQSQNFIIDHLLINLCT